MKKLSFILILLSILFFSCSLEPEDFGESTKYIFGSLAQMKFVYTIAIGQLLMLKGAIKTGFII